MAGEGGKGGGILRFLAKGRVEVGGFCRFFAWVARLSFCVRGGVAVCFMLVCSVTAVMILDCVCALNWSL